MPARFVAMASWADTVAFDQLAEFKPAEDRPLIYRPLSNLPVIVLDQKRNLRRILSARWGFPHMMDWKRANPVHTPAETVDIAKAFAALFRGGQRGIVLAKSFTEMPDGDGGAPTIVPDGEGVGLAVLWNRFDIGIPEPLFACVMVTVPANRLVAELKADRMPAILDPADWPLWLGEETATAERVKACLKTVEDNNWQVTREETPTRR